MLEAVRKLDKPWRCIKEVVPRAQHGAAWEAILTAVVLPNKDECRNEVRIMAPPLESDKAKAKFQSLPQQLLKLQEQSAVSNEQQPAAKKMPTKVVPAVADGGRVVPPPPPPPPPVHRTNVGRDDDGRDDPKDDALLGRLDLTPRRRPAKRQRTDSHGSPSSACMRILKGRLVVLQSLRMSLGVMLVAG
eukprot:4904669-Amphidinium_carterae.5